jgi:hypothetical protein
MDNSKSKEEIRFTKMKTTTRLNYRSDCSFQAGNICGILEENTIIPVVVKEPEFIHGHYWYKIRIGRKQYFAIADWFEPIEPV